MKNKLILFVVLMSVAFIGNSQIGKSATSNLLVEGDSDVGKALNIYVGPTFINGVGAAINADFEIPMFVDNLTLAPSAGIGVSNYPYSYYSGNSFNGFYRTGIKSVMILRAGVVAHYYFDWLIPKMPDKYDVFAKVRTGAIFTTDGDVDVYPFDVSAQVGGRVNFSSKASLYGAVGYGHTNVNIGLSFKF